MLRVGRSTLEVTDLGSTNGTYIEGQELKPTQAVRASFLSGIARRTGGGAASAVMCCDTLRMLRASSCSTGLRINSCFDQWSAYW
jgi:hypothetical protein